MKKLLLIIIFSLFAVNAGAWTFNHSFIDPRLLNSSCDTSNGAPVPSGDPITFQCCTQYTCTGRAADGSCAISGPCADGATETATKQGFSQNITLPVVNETCYHPTCYMRAAAQVLSNFSASVQPLTNNTDAIKNSVANLQSGYITTKLNYAFRRYSPLGVGPGGASHPYDELDYTRNYDVGTGTSAMQGLLWAWRMLSPRWQGYWSGASKYEPPGDPSVALRSAGGTLPSVGNSKNIIIISDGIDSDGPDYKPGGRTITPVVANDSQVDGHGSQIKEDDATGGADNSNEIHSMGFHATDDTHQNNVDIFEICDAHAPIQSITRDDYIAVCNRMNAEGIKVNVILYLYGADDNNGSDGRLQACAQITGGEVITDATPANIQTKISTLVADIVTRNIRLIQ